MTRKSPYLTVEEAAAMVRVSKMTVYRLVKSGTVPSIKVGNSFRIHTEDWDAYLHRNGDSER